MVELEQYEQPELSQFASLQDVYKMWVAAASGISATSMRPEGCQVQFNGRSLILTLGFYAWPSYPELEFDLDAAIGVLGPRQPARKTREVSIFVNNQDRVDLPYYIESGSFSWDTPTYNRYSENIPPPTIINHNTWLELSHETFGCLRINGVALGVYCESEITLDKPLTGTTPSAQEVAEQTIKNIMAGNGEPYTPAAADSNSYRIENLQETITASWINEEGQLTSNAIAENGELANKSLQLKVPQCAEEVLKFCPDMYQTLEHWCYKFHKYKYQAYYNTCNGNLIGVWEGEDQRSYCTTPVDTQITTPLWGIP